MSRCLENPFRHPPALVDTRCSPQAVEIAEFPGGNLLGLDGGDCFGGIAGFEVLTVNFSVSDEFDPFNEKVVLHGMATQPTAALNPASMVFSSIWYMGW